MCAKRIARILPPQSLGEVLLSYAYESLNNKDVDFSALRPFRSPHHTSTRSSIFGGGSSGAKIGEVALKAPEDYSDDPRALLPQAASPAMKPQ